MSAAMLTELQQMQAIAGRLWRARRNWWTAGEIAWTYLTGPHEQRVRLFREGWAWQQPDYLAILTMDAETIVAALDWASSTQVQVPDDDVLLREVLGRRSYSEVPDVPFDLDMRMATAGAAPPPLLDGYIVRSALPGDDLVEVHRASWRPADLPFAANRGPTFDSAAASSFTAELLTKIEVAWPYRRDLHVVVQAPDGTLAASCIAWLDAATGIAAIEPLGVRPEHRRRGLAVALCRHAAQLVDQAGGRELLIHARGDAAYPGPRGAYMRCWFRTVGRTRLYGRHSAEVDQL
jgi:ribosomal protein S18 acetylase RimI-like enzyme